MKLALACGVLLGCSSHHAAPRAVAVAPPRVVRVEPPPPPAVPPAPSRTLFERLGLPAITAVVHEFVGRTTTDPRIRDRFFNVDGANLERMLVEQVCAATGGPCTYSGRDMNTAHASMEIVAEEFDALVEDLVGALDKFSVPAAEKAELLGALGPMKAQIVAPPGTLVPLDAARLAEVAALKVEDRDAQELLAMAVIAGKRGQRSYAEQLFTRAEWIVGTDPLASVASTFRAAAPERIATPPRAIADAGPQPAIVVDEPAKKPRAKTYGSLHGAIQTAGARGLGVVMLWPARGNYSKRTPKQRVVEQRGKEFAPHVIAVPPGSTIAFPNYDPIFHNVFSLSKTRAFDLGMYRTGEAREVKFDKPGVVRIGCNLHANMAAYVIVVDAPFYAVVDDAGHYAFDALAPGKYKLQAWHEPSAAPIVTDVVVAPGDNSQDLVMAGAQAPNVDKFGAARR